MSPADAGAAMAMREALVQGVAGPAAFREALARVPPGQRDGWVDAVLGLEEVPDDGPALPRGCVPYLPSAVDTVVRMVERAGVQAGDVFVDVGAGVGRAAALTHLLTGAPAIAVEIQPALAAASRELVRRLNLSGVSVVEGDAAALTGVLASGTVFFLYCPFSGERLERVLDRLEELARARPIRVCAVDLPLPERAWLRRVGAEDGELAVYRSC